MKMKRIKPEIIAVVLILLLSFFVLWPLLKYRFFVSDDAEWMVIRLSAFFQSLRDGQFPVRFLGRLNHSYGYPVANFLYPGFLYIGSFLHALGFSFPDTVKIIIGGSVLTGTLFTFLWLRTFYALLPSFLGALGYLFAPYLAFDIYTRGSVGEVLAMAAFAASLFCIDAGVLWLLPLAIGLLIVSHNSLALLFGVFLAVYVGIKRRKSLLYPCILGLGLAAFFWIPALYERQFVVFDTLLVSTPSDYFIRIPQAPLLGLVGILSFGMLLFAKQPRARTLFFMLTFFLSVVMATPVSHPFWQGPLLGRLFQFPYRFLSLGLICSTWLIAACVVQTKKHTVLLAVLFLFLWLIPLVKITSRVDGVDRSLGYYTTNEATTTVADEYMPRWVKDKPVKRTADRMEFFTGKGTIDILSNSTQNIRAQVTASQESVLQINTVYYPGWLVADDGASTPIDYRNTQGLIRFSLPQGTHTIEANFRETPLRLVADAVTVISAIFSVFYVVRYLKPHVVRKKSKRKKP